MQIDWISGFIESPLAARQGLKLYDTGAILARSTDGEISRIGTGKVLFEGSHDSRIMISSRQGHDLYLSGNPCKHIQGHNLFGSEDAVGLFIDIGRRVRKDRGLFPSPATWGSMEFIGPRFTRLDLTRSYRFDSCDLAREWISTVAATAHSKHRASKLESGTAYFGRESARWSFKIYAKFDELMSAKKGHALSHELSDKARSELLSWSTGVVRFELTLRSLELENFPRSFDLLPVWEHYSKRITFNENYEAITMDALPLEELPRHLRAAYAVWRGGGDLRLMYSVRSFYRIRRELLEAIHVDIAHKPLRSTVQVAPVERKSRVVPGAVFGLHAKGWDPAPIECYMHRPDPEEKKRYG